MRKLFVFLFFFCLWIEGIQGAILRGRITLNTKRGEGIANVQVQVPGHNPVFTVDSGYFEKELPGIKPGYDVKLSVHLAGKEVVNGHNLEVTFKDVPSTDVHIVMCKIGERTRWACLYYEIELKEHINESHDKKLAEIKKKYAKNTQGLYEELEKLRKNHEVALNQVKKLAEQIAAVDPEKVSALYREAVTLVARGELDIAVKVLDDKKIETEARKPLEKLQDCVNAFILKAQIFITQLKFDKADTCFRKAINIDPGNFDGAYLYASFLYDQNRFKESFPLYKRALTLAQNDNDRGMILNDIANSYLKTNRFLESETAYKEALKNYRALAAKNPGAYRLYVATTLNNLGKLYSDTGRFLEGETAYKKALTIRRALAAKDPDAYRPYVATTLNNLGILYWKTDRFSESEMAYKKALTIRKTLAAKNPDAYRPYVATTLNNLGTLYSDTGRFSESETAYKEALTIRRALAAKNPDAYLPDAAMTLNNLGLWYMSLKKYKEALNSLKEALEIREKLAMATPSAYDLDLCKTLLSLYLLYLKNPEHISPPKNREKALAFKKRAFSILEKYPQIPQAQTLLKILKKKE
jgi:tetratricopeptide (TPR) repeat protein